MKDWDAPDCCLKHFFLIAFNHPGNIQTKQDEVNKLALHLLFVDVAQVVEGTINNICSFLNRQEYPAVVQDQAFLDLITAPDHIRVRHSRLLEVLKEEIIEVRHSLHQPLIEDGEILVGESHQGLV